VSCNFGDEFWGVPASISVIVGCVGVMATALGSPRFGFAFVRLGNDSEHCSSMRILIIHNVFSDA
jgi:hypothetical protein